ncbi:MAG TPA: class I SAM-dependent methyltransferase, partial [Desulfobacterales bacterium]|nr:class I SAM-dependent methyltransferase [Desulfobacterales bacterium]
MTCYNASDYGEKFADIYDRWYQTYDPYIISTLEELARGGPVLELGIGTGRIALPLAKKGIEIHGIDASPSMVAKLRAKPGGDAIPVTMGNFADVDVEGEFSLIFIAFNTFFGLPSQ